jgi:acyl dehydratase
VFDQGFDIYFDDIKVGDETTFGPYHVDKEELLAFNKRWDPLPIHLHDGEARKRGFKGLTASGQYTLCIKQLMLNQADWTPAVIGALGFDEMRFLEPVYPGDDIRLHVQCLESRASKSKPDRGIITWMFKLLNQNDSVVLHYKDTVMFSRKP